MPKGLKLTTIDKLIKANGISQEKVCNALNLTQRRFIQLKRSEFISLQFKHIMVLSAIFNISLPILTYIIFFDKILSKEEQEELQKDIEEKANNILNSL